MDGLQLGQGQIKNVVITLDNHKGPNATKQDQVILDVGPISKGGCSVLIRGKKLYKNYHTIPY